MEQRHHVQAYVARCQPQSIRDVASRGREIGMRQRHEFRACRGAGGVQEQGVVARSCETADQRSARSRPFEPEAPSSIGLNEFQNRYAEVLGRARGTGLDARLGHQRFGP